MTKDFVNVVVNNLSLKMKGGDTVDFEHDGYKGTITKEAEEYLKDFPWRIEAEKDFGTHIATVGRRYPTIESAMLHILNHFNENASIRNQYKNLNDFM